MPQDPAARSCCRILLPVDAAGSRCACCLLPAALGFAALAAHTPCVTHAPCTVHSGTARTAAPSTRVLQAHEIVSEMLTVRDALEASEKSADEGSSGSPRAKDEL
jgi:hypothetical protein